VSPKVISVSVQLSSGKVRRGQTLKLTITGPSGEAVTVALQYWHARPLTYHAKLGSNGSYARAWKIPRNAPLGKSTVKVALKSGDTPQSYSVSFVVTK
jgi:hypothetical protein